MRHAQIDEDPSSQGVYSGPPDWLGSSRGRGTQHPPEKYRLVWFEDPTTTATFVWNQLKGDPATLHYGTKDHDRKSTEYPGKQKVDKVVDFDGMKNCMVTLQNLSPDTSYFICLSDEYGVSRRFYFRTAPNAPKPFSFIAGGDSRNHRNVRQAANTMVRKLQPLFVAFTGDMINRDNATEWNDWLDDWQLTTNDNGRLIPIAPHQATTKPVLSVFPTISGCRRTPTQPSTSAENSSAITFSTARSRLTALKEHG